MEIFFVTEKAAWRDSLSGVVQVSASLGGRLLLATGAISAIEPWQRRTKAAAVERALYESAANLKQANELWQALLKKFPELSQGPFALCVVGEDGAIDAKVNRLGAVLVRGTRGNKCLAISGEKLSLRPEDSSEATELVFVEGDVSRAEAVQKLLQDTEGLLGPEATKRLLAGASASPVEAALLDLRVDLQNLSRKSRPQEIPQEAPPRQQQPWFPWLLSAGALVVALLSLLLAFSGGLSSAASAPVDNKPRFIPQPEQTAEVDTPKPEKKTTKTEPKETKEATSEPTSQPSNKEKTPDPKSKPNNDKPKKKTGT